MGNPISAVGKITSIVEKIHVNDGTLLSFLVILPTAEIGLPI